VLLQWLNQETSERSTQLWFDVTTEGLVLSWSAGLKAEFKASCGWLTRLKKCCICELPKHAELLSAYTAAGDSICIEFKKFMLEENLKPD
jgi:hypothetical protein